jgi:CSLREA domain-containing protein
LLATLIVGLALMLLPAMAAHAASFTVTTTADTADVKPGDGKCADSTDPMKAKCSLRAAIQESNKLGGDNVITLGKATSTLTKSLPPISSSVTIQGVSAGATVIRRPCIESTRNEVGECSSAPEFRIFDVAEKGALTLIGLTVRNGQSGGGGGIFNQGSLTLIESTVMANHGHVGGGGIVNYGKLWLVDSTVRDNFGHNGSGGGLWNAGEVQIWGSTISGNKSTYAGGIYNGSNGEHGGSLTITNSTISGNQVTSKDGYAGGILNDGIGDAWLWSVTITANTAPSAGGVWGHIKGSGNFYFANTIMAGNTVTGSVKVAPDCYGSVITLGGDLVGNPTNCLLTPWSSDQAGDKIGEDPNLGPLADNGGPSCTHQLRDGSPAIDAAWPDQPGSGGFACETFDQRRATRVNRCDIGAYEAYVTAEPHQLGCRGGF